MEEAIRAVMFLYEISREDAIQYYWDEVEAYMGLKEKLKKDAS